MSVLSSDYWNDDYAQADEEWELAGNDGNFIGAEEIFWTGQQNDKEWYHEQYSPMSDQHFSSRSEGPETFAFSLEYDFDQHGFETPEEENSSVTTNSSKQHNACYKVTYYCKRERRNAS
jgi:hypothetical protein